MVRATTGGVLRSYRADLMKSFISMNNSRDTVLTQRNFNSYAEDPASAAKAFKLRKSRMAVQSQYKINDSSYRKFQTAWSCLDTVDKLIDTDNGKSITTLKGMTLKMLNDPTGDARKTLSKALDELSETIVQTMNQKYGDSFIFAGADGYNVPFEVVDNKLYYRGVPVDAAVPDLQMDNATPPAPITDANGDYVLASAEKAKVPDLQGTSGTPTSFTAADSTVFYVNNGVTPTTQADYNTIVANDPTAKDLYYEDTGKNPPEYYLKSDTMTKDAYDDLQNNILKDGNNDPIKVQIGGKDYYVMQGTDKNPSTISKEDYEKAQTDLEKLNYLVNEKRFVDIGLGFQENENNQLIESSGFNDALNGLTFLGYGVDADGDPKNIYSLVQRMKDLAASVEDGQDWTEAQYDEFDRLVGKLEDASSEFKVEYTGMDAGTTKLKNNLALLEENFYNLQEQYAALEDVDMADALTSFVWAQYCYNAALKVGNNVLSESLMDYLN